MSPQQRNSKPTFRFLSETGLDADQYPSGAFAFRADLDARHLDREEAFARPLAFEASASAAPQPKTSTHVSTGVSLLFAT